jgi:hypothetical protein
MDDARLTSRADNIPDIYAIVSAFRYAHNTADVLSFRRAFE